MFCRLGGKPPGTFLSAKIEKTCNRAVLAASIMLTMAVQQPYLWAYGTAISLVVLLCAEREIPIAQVGRRDQSLVPFSGGRNQTAYQSLLRMQRERRATGTSEPDSVAPIVAKAAAGGGGGKYRVEVQTHLGPFEVQQDKTWHIDR